VTAGQPDEAGEPVVVIACYRPKPGKEAGLAALMTDHLPILQGLGLATDRASIMARAADGTVIEVFEWRSQAHIDAAHENPEVLAMWERYAEVCDYVPIAEVPEAAELFSGFAPME